jgi:hypothetical protein
MQLDVPNFAGNNFQFTMPVGNEEMIINSLAPITSSKVVPLKSKFNGSMGMHKFVMSEIESFDANTFIFLRDNWTGTLENISFNPEYTFEVNPSNIGMEDRFELVFTPDGVTGTNANLNGFQIGLYPNPTSSQINLNYAVPNDNSLVKIEIFNMYGKLIGSYNQGILNAGTYLFSADMKETTRFESLSNGIYICNLNIDGSLISKKFILNR